MPGKRKVKRSTERNEKRWWCCGVKRREIQYCIHKCSTYFGECLWRIMYYALTFNKKFWDLACPLSWRCNLFSHQKSATDKTRYQVAWFILHLKQKLNFWFEQIFKKMKSKGFITKGLVVMVLWMPLENYAAIGNAKGKVWEVWFDGILVFTAKHCYLLEQSKQRWLQMQTLLWINGSAFGRKKKKKVK